MRFIPLGSASEIYTYTDSYQIKRQQLSHPGFASFCSTLRNLERSLGETATDGYWKPLLRFLRNYRFVLSAAPLPFDHPSVYSVEKHEALQKCLAYCEQIYPGFAPAAHILFESIAQLVARGENPILDCLVGLEASQSQSAALVLKESSLFSPVASVLASSPFTSGIEIIGASDLSGGTCFSRLIVIGPSRWYPEHVFTAPRAREILLVHYRWIRDNWKPGRAFIGSAGRLKVEQEDVQRPFEEEPELIAEMIPAEDLLPTIDWKQISQSYAVAFSTDTNMDQVEARLFALEGRQAVFLDAAEDSTTIVIDLDDDTSQVQRIPVSEIRPGLFVLLRTGGGGDYIVELADRVLGENAITARGYQKNWKARLRAAVRSSSLLAASVDLLGRGSVLANEVNLRNWMSERNIKTSDKRDFAAIMDFIGMTEKTEEYWNVMRKIDSAHRVAGRYIRRLLLKQVHSSDLKQLERTGRMDFTLPGVDGRSLTAFRVVDISPTLSTVPATRLAHPFSIVSFQL